MAEGQDEDKQYEPTQKKLDDARRKGEVPRSADLTAAASYGGFLVVALSVGGPLLTGLGAVLTGLIARPDSLSADLFSGGHWPILGTILAGIAGGLAPWLLVPAALAIVSVVVQRSFVVAPEKLKPKASRIGLLSNAKNKFGRSGLFEFAKSFFKLTVYSAVLGVFLWRRMPEVVGTLALSPAMATAVLLDLCVQFLSLVVLIALAIGAVDFLWQRHEHLRRHRMSRKEMMDEAKQAEGDPHMKQQRRQRGYDIAMNRMLADVPEADVVVVNPTHYAVALKWSRAPGAAPICVAKGVDEIAARIREVAAEAGVPIHRDPPCARAIHASVGVGEEIRPEHYQQIAAAIRFAEAMRQKMRARTGRISGPAPR
ncbi:EscU/YscU/HrcU family type III secretion system export apparatus switch protein [Maritimibacter fusiformis]|uniref:Flagellar biosynthesis protein FlhB n=1 Tax=Maritimibacter fusiformis TaxID=2603819 RepID=A0A5D0RAG5_9RHOB|nr:flagellar type III secretion system protein FlhB [Maritimibacter fusiformis]TYB77891.1 flagellar biosynthesis protein FlhB [Maritimibacter fusiformis]